MTRRSALLAMLTVWCAAAAPAGVPDLREAGVDHDGFDEILRSAVRGESVDYDFVRRQRADALDDYLARLASIDPSSLDRDERLAFYLNLYNATMIDVVVERAGEGWTVAADDFAVFDEPLVGLDGGAVSLDHLEHSIVRPEFGDPRIHAALVCAARSCPPLLDRAYRGADLDAALDARMRRFVGDASRNRLDHDARRMALSSIFEWYADDFGGPAALDDYVNRWVARDVEGYAVEFLPYSWELNSTD